MVLLWGDETLTDNLVEELSKSFPALQVVRTPLETLQKQQSSICQAVDIVYARDLNLKHLQTFGFVKWMHAASYLNKALFLPLKKSPDVLVTYLLQQPSMQYLDFATSLLFSCCQGEPCRKEWTIESIKPFSRSIVVLMGFSPCAHALAQRARQVHMRVFGVSTQPSYHPDYDKVLSYEQLHSVLPVADVVILCAGQGDEKRKVLGVDELSLMKMGSSLFVLGSQDQIDTQALRSALSSCNLLRMWLDYRLQEDADHLHINNAQSPHVLATPGLIDTLGADREADFHFFLWNLDCFYHGRYVEMKGLWDLGPARLLERRGLCKT